MSYELTNQHCLFSAPAHPDVKVCVVVPVKDEEDNIVQTLKALHFQKDEFGQALNSSCYETLVLVNNSVDASFGLCRQYQQQHPDFNLHICQITLPQDVAHIGTVRKLLMDEACNRLLQVPDARGIIVSTDGDSMVDEQFVYQIMLEFDKDVDVVSGRIIARDLPKAAKLPHLRDVGYRFLVSRLEAYLDPSVYDPWPRHFQCYGPSIAVTCRIYQKAGGIKAIPCLEDEEFRKALKRIDAKMRKSPKVKIYTSSRLAGRVPFGFSVQLRQWQEMQLAGTEQVVESFSTVHYRLVNKKRLRLLWLQDRQDADTLKGLKSYAEKLELDAGWLENSFLNADYFEALWEEVDAVLFHQNNVIHVAAPISKAMQEFRAFFA
ncbi:MAG: glycosyltransferase [Pedobacter sp.]|nr:MAG: glycosyltransferase [Pedobacter sp.]